MTAAIIALLFHLEAGYMPLDTLRNYAESYPLESVVERPIYATLGVDVEVLGVFFIGGSVRTDMSIEELAVGHFSPFGENFMFHAGLRPVPGLELGFRHHCIHPLVTYMRNKSFALNFEGAYQEIYLKVDVKVDLIK